MNKKKKLILVLLIILLILQIVLQEMLLVKLEVEEFMAIFQAKNILNVKKKIQV